MSELSDGMDAGDGDGEEDGEDDGDRSLSERVEEVEVRIHVMHLVVGVMVVVGVVGGVVVFGGGGGGGESASAPVGVDLDWCYDADAGVVEVTYAEGEVVEGELVVRGGGERRRFGEGSMPGASVVVPVERGDVLRVVWRGGGVEEFVGGLDTGLADGGCDVGV